MESGFVLTDLVFENDNGGVLAFVFAATQAPFHSEVVRENPTNASLPDFLGGHGGFRFGTGEANENESRG